MPETISISPKLRYVGDTGAAAVHSDLMASPAFQRAASTALLEYQYRIARGDLAALSISAAKLRGAQEFIDVLLNLGIPSTHSTVTTDSALTPPEESLDRPYKPTI